MNLNESQFRKKLQKIMNEEASADLFSQNMIADAPIIGGGAGLTRFAPVPASQVVRAAPKLSVGHDFLQKALTWAGASQQAADQVVQACAGHDCDTHLDGTAFDNIVSQFGAAAPMASPVTVDPGAIAPSEPIMPSDNVVTGPTTDINVADVGSEPAVTGEIGFGGEGGEGGEVEVEEPGETGGISEPVEIEEPGETGEVEEPGEDGEEQPAFPPVPGKENEEGEESI